MLIKRYHLLVGSIAKHSARKYQKVLDGERIKPIVIYGTCMMLCDDVVDDLIN